MTQEAVTRRMKRLSEFRNEPYTDFTQPANRERMVAAQEKVRGELGREYPRWIGGEKIFSQEKHKSLNPSRPSEVVGTVQKATPEMAERAVMAAYEYFPEWSRTPASQRIEMLLKTARIIRERKNEFNAW